MVTTRTNVKESKGTAFHIPSLDGLRAVSFLLVFAAHAGLEDKVPGGFGVTVFFFLSGYLITTLMRMEWEGLGTVSFKQFYLRRVLRILPPFYLTLALAIAAAAVGLIPGGFSPFAVLAQALHSANYWIIFRGYGGQPAGTGVYWSLAVEEHFYLFFPLVFVLLGRFVRTAGRRATILYGLCAAVLVWRMFLVHGLHVGADRTYVGSDTRIDSILFGCALAVYGNPVMDGPSRFSERVWKWGLLPASIGVLLFTFLYRDGSFRETTRYSLQGLALTPLFVTAVRWPTWLVFRPLNTRLASFLGVLSYSLYLVHHVILFGVHAHVHVLPVLQGALALALSIALAWAIYRFVEKPCAVLRKRLSRASKASAVARTHVAATTASASPLATAASTARTAPSEASP
ncbi:MAG TPA: acyltransferase [Polyangiaceae bacterium]